MSTKFFPYTKQWIDEADVEAVAAALREPMITRGPKVEAFEEGVAAFCGAQHAVAFNSGTSALSACYFAAEAGPNDRVIVPTNTFFGTVAGALTLGARVELADIDATTGNIDLESLPDLSFPTRGRLIYTPVHFTGVPVDMKGLNRKIRQPSALVIEDAAHAFGASYPDKGKVGCCSDSDMTVFSFHPSKTITTGEGGLVTTNDAKLAERLRLFRNNGLVDHHAQAATGNFHMTDIGAALGLSQMVRTNTIIKKRRALVRTYRKLLADMLHVTPLPDTTDAHSSHHLFVVLIDFEKLKKERASVREALREAGVGTQVHYRPLYDHPLFRSPEESQFPGSRSYYSKALSLPLYYNLTEGNVKAIVRALGEALGHEPAAAPQPTP